MSAAIGPPPPSNSSSSDRAPSAREVLPQELSGGSIPAVTYRGDSRTPDEIFETGFQSKNPTGEVSRDSLLDYTKNNSASPYVSTSRDSDVAEDFAKWNDGWTYQVDTGGSQAIDVNHALGKDSPFADEKEIAIVGGVDNTSIISATDPTTGEVQKNPNYKGGAGNGPPVNPNPPPPPPPPPEDGNSSGAGAVPPPPPPPEEPPHDEL